MSRRVGAHPSPLVAFLLHIWIFHLFDFLEKIVGPVYT